MSKGMSKRQFSIDLIEKSSFFSKYEKAILLSIIENAKPIYAIYSLNQLKNELNISKPTIIKYLKKLEKMELISISSNKVGLVNLKNNYTPNLVKIESILRMTNEQFFDEFLPPPLLIGRLPHIIYSYNIISSSLSSSYGNNIFKKKKKRNETKKRKNFNAFDFKTNSPTTSDEVGLVLCENTKIISRRDLMKVNQQDIIAVFEFWQQEMNHRRTKLDSKLSKLISNQLILYSVEDLKDAIRGCKLSAFHMGDNDRGKVYDSLNLILRDSEHVGQFIAMFERPPVARVKKRTPYTESERAAEARAVTQAHLIRTYGTSNPFFPSPGNNYLGPPKAMLSIEGRSGQEEEEILH
jgi:DNA-binding Lrp family transcriptional regulator